MDPRDLLERARTQAPAPRTTLVDLDRRRERRQRIRRIEAVVVGLAFAVASIGAASLVLRGNPAPPAAGDGSHPGLPSAPTSDGTEDVNATWPETSLVDAQQAQVRADAGDPEVQWRTDAATVALRYARVVLGWPDPIAGVTATDDPDTVIVSLHGPDASCQGAACSDPQPRQTIVTVTLQRLVRQGDGGIWSVTVVDGSQEPSEPVPS